MDFDIAVWLGGVIVVVIVWITMALSWGFVRSVDDHGFTLRTLLNTQRRILWNSLAPRVDEFESFPARVILRAARGRFSILHSSFAVLLRDRPVDIEFRQQLTKRHSIKPVGNLGDL